MKKQYTLFILAISVLFANTSYSQRPSFLWERTIEGQTNEIIPKKIIADNSGNVYVAGLFSPSQDFGSTTLTGDNTPSVYVIKYNTNGDIVWAIGESKNDFTGSTTITDLKMDKDGNLYLTGWFYQGNTLLSLGGKTISGYKDNGDGFIFKIDPDNGQSQWALSISGTSVESINGVTTDNSGNVYLTGFLRSTDVYLQHIKGGAITSDTLHCTKQDMSDMLVVKYDADGGLIWSKSFGTDSAFEVGSSIALDDNNNVYVGGYWDYSPTTSFGSIHVKNNGPNNFDQIILKLDENGNEQWAKAPKGGANDYISQIEIKGNRLYTLGHFSGDLTYTTITTVAKDGNNYVSHNLLSNLRLQTTAYATRSWDYYDVFLAKYDLDGNVKWSQVVSNCNELASPGSPVEHHLSDGLSINASGEAFVSASFEADTVYIGSNEVYNNGQKDFFLAKYNAAGNASWSLDIGGSGNEYNGGLSCDNDDHIFIAGGFSYLSTILLGNYSLTSADAINDMFVAKIEDYIAPVSSNISENAIEKNEINIYPNPFVNNVTIKLALKEDADVTIDLLDLTGREISNIYNGKINKGISKYTIAAENRASGTYFIAVKTNGDVSRKLLYHVK